MSKLLIFLLAITLWSCSSSTNLAGGVSEAGNGFIQITLLSPEGEAAGNIPVVITPRDYLAESQEITLPAHLTGADGSTEIFANRSGEWNIYAEENESVLFTPCSIEEGDTVKIALAMSHSGTVHSDAAAEIIIPGAPRIFAVEDASALIPPGHLELLIRDSSGVIHPEEAVVVSNETTEIGGSGSKISIYSSEISSVYNLSFDGDSAIAYSTGSGLTLERRGVRKQFTKENSPLLSNWVRDAVLREDTVTVATDSGIVIFTEDDTVHLRGGKEIPHDWVIHFLERDEEIWFVTQTGIGTLVNGRVAQLYTSANSPLPSDGISSISEDPAGGVLVGTQTAVFSFRNSVWQKNDGFLSGNSSLSTTAVAGTWDDLWLTTNGSGLFHKSGDIWSSYTDTTSILPGNSLHTLLVDGETIITGGKDGVLVTGTAENLTAEQIAQGDIISLNRRSDGSLWIGTLYQGVTVLLR